MDKKMSERERSSNKERNKERKRKSHAGRGFWQRDTNIRKTLTMKSKMLPTTLKLLRAEKTMENLPKASEENVS